ncbi:MAG: hypothetical protein HQL54_12485 [Magnetococcales bacterium]|nr:hypothetical protein [Magnetococcales bacterium]
MKLKIPTTSEGRLWASVLRRAVLDFAIMERCLSKDPNLVEDREFSEIYQDLYRWFLSKNSKMGSYAWICQQFGWDSDAIWNRLKRNLSKHNITLDEKAVLSYAGS